MIKKVVFTQYDLKEEFKKYNRLNNFTRYDLLFNHLDSLEEDYNLDIIELCSSFEEFSSIKEYNSNYSKTYKTIEELSQDYFVLYDNEDNSFIVINH
jgi:hypothetical protein